MLNLVDGQITGSGLFSKQAQGHEFEGPPKKQGQSKIFASYTKPEVIQYLGAVTKCFRVRTFQIARETQGGKGRCSGL